MQRLLRLLKEGAAFPTTEMFDWFNERTNQHIALVKKYAEKLVKHDPKKFKLLVENTKMHDASKFEDPEHIPYVHRTWMHKCETYKPSQEIIQQTHEAIVHHVMNNKHHPEYWSEKTEALSRYAESRIERQGGEWYQPTANNIDATRMPSARIAEMVADWCAMAEELGTNCKEWADKKVNVRWRFTGEQKKLIYELIQVGIV